MEFIKSLIEIALHVDKHLNVVIQSFGNWSYLVLFAVIFAETGLVVTPFLPGDSLLFAVGAFSALGSFDLWWLYASLLAAAIIGDSVNYAFGKYIGRKAFKDDDSRFFRKEHLERTHRFYEKHGGKTIILARFVPIVRTFAPFVAGMGKMDYRYFFAYNVVGAVLWVSIFVLGGYFFGNAPMVKENFTIAIFAIMFISVLPVIIELWKYRKTKSGLQPQE